MRWGWRLLAFLPLSEIREKDRYLWWIRQKAKNWIYQKGLWNLRCDVGYNNCHLRCRLKCSIHDGMYFWWTRVEWYLLRCWIWKWLTWRWIQRICWRNMGTFPHSSYCCCFSFSIWLGWRWRWYAWISLPYGCTNQLHTSCYFHSQLQHPFFKDCTCCTSIKPRSGYWGICSCIRSSLGNYHLRIHWILKTRRCQRNIFHWTCSLSCRSSFWSGFILRCITKRKTWMLKDWRPR